jgi:hypothetical protein
MAGSGSAGVIRDPHQVHRDGGSPNQTFDALVLMQDEDFIDVGSLDGLDVVAHRARDAVAQAYPEFLRT